VSRKSMGNCHRFVMETRLKWSRRQPFLNDRILQSFDNSETSASLPVGTV
jgi:hypothetical protein